MITLTNVYTLTYIGEYAGVFFVIAANNETDALAGVVNFFKENEKDYKGLGLTLDTMKRITGVTADIHGYVSAVILDSFRYNE